MTRPREWEVLHDGRLMLLSPVRFHCDYNQRPSGGRLVAVDCERLDGEGYRVRLSSVTGRQRLIGYLQDESGAVELRFRPLLAGPDRQPRAHQEAARPMPLADALAWLLARA